MDRTMWYLLAGIIILSAVAFVFLNAPPKEEAPIEECVSACKSLSSQGLELSTGLCIFSDKKGYSCSVLKPCRSFKEGKTGQIILDSSCRVLKVQEKPS